MTAFSVGQYCRFVRETNDFRIHAFCLYLDGSRQALGDVSVVEYTLHPSFPEPVRTSTDRDHAFPLQSEAWREFTTYIRVFTRDGATIHFEHQLLLSEDAWPMGEKLDQLSSPIEQSMYNALFDSKLEWRKLSSLARRASISLAQAKEILIRLEEKGAVRKAPYVQSIDQEEFWGATSVVGILPSPK